MVCLLDDPNRNTLPAQTSDQSEAAAVSAHNQSTGRRRGLLIFYSLRNRVVLENHRAHISRLFRDVASQCAGGKPGPGNESHQGSKAPRRWSAKEVQAGD